MVLDDISRFYLHPYIITQGLQLCCRFMRPKMAMKLLSLCVLVDQSDESKLPLAFKDYS